MICQREAIQGQQHGAVSNSLNEVHLSNPGNERVLGDSVKSNQGPKNLK